MAASWETINVDGSDMRMYLSIPNGSGPFPAVVVSQHGHALRPSQGANACPA